MLTEFLCCVDRPVRMFSKVMRYKVFTYWTFHRQWQRSSLYQYQPSSDQFLEVKSGLQKCTSPWTIANNQDDHFFFGSTQFYLSMWLERNQLTQNGTSPFLSLKHVKVLKGARREMSPWMNWNVILFLKISEVGTDWYQRKCSCQEHSLPKWFNGEMFTWELCKFAV